MDGGAVNDIARPLAAPGPVVLYIAGWGRSGSTLLERLLDGEPGVTSVGELFQLVGSGRVTRTCECGERIADCPVWSTILAALSDDPARQHQYRADLRRTYRTVLRTRHLWRITSSTPPPAAGQFACLAGRLYTAAAEQAGAAVVVDASKVSTMLAGVTAGDTPVVVVHLVRNPLAVAASWRRVRTRPDRRPLRRLPPTRSALEWIVRNLEVEFVVARRRLPALRVCYDELVRSPAAVTAEALRLAGLADPQVAHVRGHRAALHPGHALGGNPSRWASGEVEIRADEGWRRELGPLDRAVVRVVAGPLWWWYRRQGWRP